MDIKPLPGDYVAGFVDGEGCFALNFRRDKKLDRPGSPEYFYWRVEFAIMLSGSEKYILECIKETIGCGRIDNPDKRGNIRYSVTSLDDLVNKVVPFFNKFQLRAKKKQDFILWSRAVGIMAKNKRKGLNIKKGSDGFQKLTWNKSNLDEIEEIRDEMTNYKGGNRHDWRWLPKK